MNNSNDIVILIPAYNPTTALIELTDNLIKNHYSVVIVNDGSNEKCKSIFDCINKNAILLTHEQNLGKGQALKTGFTYIKENLNCMGIVTADADGQHLFEDIRKVSNALLETPDALILGSREELKKAPFKSRAGNTITRKIFKLATGEKVFDTQTGLRAIASERINDLLQIEGNRYEYEMNMLLFFASNHIPIIEVPINVVYLDHNSASSFKVVKDSYRIYKCIFKNSNLKTIIPFSISSILSFLIDYFLVINLVDIFRNNHVYDVALLYSVIIARIISSLFNFSVNRLVVFKAKENILKALGKYYSLALFIIIANYLLLDVLAVKLNWNLKISKIIVETIMYLFSYFIQKKYISK